MFSRISDELEKDQFWLHRYEGYERCRKTNENENENGDFDCSSKWTNYGKIASVVNEIERTNSKIFLATKPSRPANKKSRRRIIDFFLSWAGGIHCSLAQNKTPVSTEAGFSML